MPDVSPPTLDPRRCPLCGGDNACGIAAGAATCWCFDTVISAELIERVPADLQDQSCICPACGALRSGAATAETPLQDK